MPGNMFDALQRRRSRSSSPGPVEDQMASMSKPASVAEDKKLDNTKLGLAPEGAHPEKSSEQQGMQLMSDQIGPGPTNSLRARAASHWNGK